MLIKSLAHKRHQEKICAKKKTVPCWDFTKSSILPLPCVAGVQAWDFCSYEFDWKDVGLIHRPSEVASSEEVATSFAR